MKWKLKACPKCGKDEGLGYCSNCHGERKTSDIPSELVQLPGVELPNAKDKVFWTNDANWNTDTSSHDPSSSKCDGG